MDAFERLSGCPRIVRGDQGTENVRVRDFQCFLRRNIHNGTAIDSYIEGASTSNQRRKSWWVSSGSNQWSSTYHYLLI